MTSGKGSGRTGHSGSLSSLARGVQSYAAKTGHGGISKGSPAATLQAAAAKGQNPGAAPKGHK
jgi:hypothetical protein